MYIYMQTEKRDHDNPTGLWTVGFYDPDGKFQTEDDYSSKAGAVERVHYLNGGNENENLRNFRANSYTQR